VAFFLFYVVLAVAAWVKVGPIAGVVATVGLLVFFFIASRPGGSLWTSGQWSSPSHSRAHERLPDTHADSEKNRRA
jgi:hypothetical protein